MNWASQRRFLYIAGIVFFFATFASIPIIMWLHRPATCFDGIQNQGETDVDKGGPCKLLDDRYLIPQSIQWVRPFPSRPHYFSAVAYIENPNQNAGVKSAAYDISIYNDSNVLVAERQGTTPITPGSITPVFEGDLYAGDRIATHAFFEFVAPPVWERLKDRSSDISVSQKSVADVDTAPRVSAVVTNNGVTNFTDTGFVAVIYDPAGNAFAASHTLVPRFDARDTVTLTFTWPQPFTRRVARVDVLPVVPPAD